MERLLSVRGSVDLRRQAGQRAAGEGVLASIAVALFAAIWIQAVAPPA